MKNVIDNIILFVVLILFLFSAYYIVCHKNSNDYEIEDRITNLKYELEIRHLEYEILMLELDKEFNKNLVDTLLKIKRTK